MKPQPKVTIVIATRNRADILKECLQSLTMQTASKDQYNVLIVDNNSTDTTSEVAEFFVKKYDNFEYVLEKNIGHSPPRNCGMLKSTTEWVATLDDDARAHPNWIERMMEIIKMDCFDCFGGVYLAWFKYGKPPVWYGDDWGSNKSIQNHFGLLPDSLYPSGGNAVYRRAVVLDNDCFSIKFGMSGDMKNPAYGEETDLINRMRKNGARVGFVPDMLIDHCVMPHKYKLKWHILSRFASARDYERLSVEKISSIMLLKLIAHLMLISIITLFFPLYVGYKFLTNKQRLSINMQLIESLLILCSRVGGVAGVFSVMFLNLE